MPSDIAILQAGRLLRINTPLGPDVLVLRRLRVREAIGEPFVIEAECLSAELELPPGELINQPITCTVERRDLEPRHFNGICTRFSHVGTFARGLALYRLEARPKLWMLSRRVQSRIFQDQTVQQIVEQLVKDVHAATPLRWASSMSLKPRPYVVQFNESDLDFVSRLIEEVGHGYAFTHDETSHTMVVCGASADWPAVPGEPPTVRPEGDLLDALTTFQPATALPVGKVTALDYDQLNPSKLLKLAADTTLKTPNAATYEVYRWPGGQAVQPDANPALLAMQGAEAAAERTTVVGRDPNVFAGGRFKLFATGDSTQPDALLVVEALHEAFDETSLAANGTADYHCRMQLMPGNRPWRPVRPRPRPPIPGLHCAIVTGQPGDEIHCDKHGRIKVRFLWDRTPGKDDASSCFVRVAQPFAGAWGGTWFLPRVGDEVLVGFVDGDPDRPVVIGSLYNAEAPPPFALPAKKTQSGIRTKSSKGGGADNFNQLRFDDEKGKEEVNFQAERDFNLLIKRNRTETVRNDRTEAVQGKHTETVTKDFTLKVTEGNRVVEIVKGNHDFTVSKGNWVLDTKMGHIDTIAGMGNISTKADMGDIGVKASLGAINEEAMQKIVLKVGQSSITIDQTGVEIKGLIIKIAASAMYEIKGPLGQVKADALLIVKGGLVLIN